MAKQITLFILLFVWCSIAGFSQSQKAVHSEAKALCNRVSEIKALPHYDENGVDAAYDALAQAGESVVPCLIDKITDTTIMPDPRCPRISDTKVGDVAYFVLVRIIKIGFSELFPPDVKDTYKKEGVFAYHEYIERRGKRKELQLKFREWYRQQQKAKS